MSPLDELREQVLQRDNYTCQNCNTTSGRLETHHRIPRSKGGPDTLDNLILLCVKCHRSLEPREEPKIRRIVSMDIETYQKLKTFGRFGESFDDLLNRLMKEVREKPKK